MLHTRTGNIEARSLLGRALSITPNFAAALGFLAVTHVIDYVNGWGDLPEDSLKIGLEIAQRAIQVDEEEAQGHFALAVALLWHREHEKALVQARRCVALEPNSAEGHIAIATILTYSGNAEAAISTIDAYMRLDPFYKYIVLYFLAEARISLGQFDEAVAALKLRLERNPNSETSSCYGQLGRFEEARAAWAEVLRIAPNFSIERRSHVLPFKNPDDFERRIEGMRKAGLPV